MIPGILRKWRRADAPVALNAANQPIAAPRGVVREAFGALARVLFVAIGIYSLLCAFRWFAPLSSFNEVTAIGGAIGVPTILAFAKLAFQTPLGKLKTWLRTKGYDLDRLLGLVRVPDVHPVLLILEVPIVYALWPLYAGLQPALIAVESGGVNTICSGIYHEQPYRTGGKIPQGFGTPSKCDDAFAREYQTVTIRPNRMRRVGGGSVTVEVDKGLIGYVAFAKTVEKQRIHLEGFPKEGKETGSAAPAGQSVKFILDPDVSDSAAEFRAFIAVAGDAGSTIKVTASVDGIDAKRSRDVRIPLSRDRS